MDDGHKKQPKNKNVSNFITKNKCNQDKNRTKGLKKRIDAISELEDLYASLHLDDDQLLDRAERRDLPLKFQQRWHHPDDTNDAHDSKQDLNDKKATQGHLNGTKQKPINDNNNNDYEYFNKRRSVATQEALSAMRDDTYLRGRSRTPPYRRSAIPDIVTDDLAIRKFNNNNNMSQSQLSLCCSKSDHNTSYLLMSPLYTPTLFVDAIFKDLNDFSTPNIEFDDLSYRKLKQSDAANVLPPHPPFGIPNYTVTHSSPNDYLRSEWDLHELAKMRYRCKSHVPHLIHDDMAFRSLRKDARRSTPKANCSPPPFIRPAEYFAK